MISRKPTGRVRAAVLAAAGVVMLAVPIALGTTQNAAAAAGDPLGLSCADYPGGDRICSGEIASFDTSPLDVDVTLPAAGTGGTHPLAVFLHGFGNNKHEWESTTEAGDGADKYRWNNHWFAQHGYYVLTYTARGFTDAGPNRADEPNTPSGTAPNCPKDGSACLPVGTIRVKNKDVEIRDTQYLAALVAHAFPDIDPNQAAVTGGSYGGGESWLQAAQPTWTFPSTVDPALPVLQVQVAVPKYPWTDLAYALVPNGHPGPGGSLYDSAQGAQGTLGDGNPVGAEKASYVSGLYALGTTNGIFEEGNSLTPQTNGPEPFSAWLSRISAGEPYDAPGRVDDPVIAQIRHDFSGWHSAFYSPGWATQRASQHETAVFSISGWTDTLFPPVESFRMFDYLKSLDPLWPVAVAVGDVGHSIAQNPPAVWKRFNDQAWQFVQANITGAHRQSTTVTSEPVLCSLDALSNTAVVDPAQELTAQTPAGLPAGQLVVVAGKPATLTPTSGADDTNGPATDPIIGPTAFPHPDCRVATSPTAGSTGYTVYSTALNQQETLVGIGWTEARYSSLTQGTSALLAERLWDVAPDGTASLVTHGIYRFDFNGYDPPSGTVRVPFFGTHWILAPGHRLRLDLEQVDSPTFRPPNPDATATLTLSGIRTVYGTRQATTVTVPAS